MDFFNSRGLDVCRDKLKVHRRLYISIQCVFLSESLSSKELQKKYKMYEINLGSRFEKSNNTATCLNMG